jgi:hypothetical protein
MDVSRTTIFVLVILTLLISILGTWTVLSQLNAATPVAADHATASGKVSFTITPPPQTDAIASGKVTFAIKNPE